MAIKRIGRRVGDQGEGIAEVAARPATRSCSRRKQAGGRPTRWSPDSRSRWQAVGGKLSEEDGTPPTARVSATSDLNDPRNATSYRVDRRGPHATKKQKSFKRPRRIVKAGPILATTRPPSRCREAGRRPTGQVCGITLQTGADDGPRRIVSLSPPATDDQRGAAFAETCGKQAVEASTKPLIVNNLLFPYLNNPCACSRTARHQGGHEKRMRAGATPDGPSPARPRRPRHQPEHPRGALRGVKAPLRPTPHPTHGGGEQRDGVRNGLLDSPSGVGGFGGPLVAETTSGPFWRPERARQRQDEPRTRRSAVHDGRVGLSAGSRNTTASRSSTTSQPTGTRRHHAKPKRSWRARPRGTTRAAPRTSR